MKKNISLTAALMLTAAPIFAQDAIILDDIVVSAGIQDIALNRTGASVDVIESEELAAAGTNMSIALDGVAGIATNTSGGFGAASGIRLRGLSQNYVAVRIDGIDYSDPTGTQNAFDFGGMTTLGFDRVEVLKGSQSAIYGSEAIGGVISFKTNSDADLGQTLKLGMEIGSYNTRTYDMKLSSVTETGSTSLAIIKTATDGFSAKSDNDEADAHSKTEVRFAADLDVTENISLGLNALTSKSETDYDAYGVDDHVTAKRNGIGLDLEYRGEAITHQLSLSRAITDRYDVEGWNNSFISTRDTARYTANMTFGIADFSLGAERTIEEANIDGSITIDKETAYFAEALVAVNSDIDVSAAIRASQSDEFGSANVYRLAAIYRFNDSTTLRAMMSTGYRAPSQYERYSWAGNPDFKPEESTTFEIGASHQYASGSVSATYFDNTVDNVIDYNSTTYAYEQIGGSSKSRGLEISGEFKLSDAISLTGNYTYTDSKNGEVRIVRVPTHDLTLGVAAAVGDKTHLAANVQIAKDIEDLVWPNNVPVDDYTVVNLSAAYDLSDDAQAYVRIENAFDEDYETVKGFNTGGRMIFAGVRASF